MDLTNDEAPRHPRGSFLNSSARASSVSRVRFAVASFPPLHFPPHPAAPVILPAVILPAVPAPKAGLHPPHPPSPIHTAR
jgi:hypothetical protein